MRQSAIIGGTGAPASVAGEGAGKLADSLQLTDLTVEKIGPDLMVTGYPLD